MIKVKHRIAYTEKVAGADVTKYIFVDAEYPESLEELGEIEDGNVVPVQGVSEKTETVVEYKQDAAGKWVGRKMSASPAVILWIEGEKLRLNAKYRPEAGDTVSPSDFKRYLGSLSGTDAVIQETLWEQGNAKAKATVRSKAEAWLASNPA